MTVPVFLAPVEVLAGARPGTEVEVVGPEARHAVTVRRTAVGERVDLVDGAGRRVSGPVSWAERDRLVVAVTDVTDEPEPDPSFVLVQALAKGDRDGQAVEAATELGVDRVVPWQAQRSIVRWRGERGERSRRAWADTITAAAKQSRRSRVPAVDAVVDLTALAGLVEASASAFILHALATESLAGQRLPERGRVLVVVGPEGGVTAAELDVLRDAGGVPVRLGREVLRSSSAGPAALAVLSTTSRWR